MTTPIPAAATVADLLPETPAPMPAHTYKLTRRARDGRIETVASGLTWQDAKSQRNAHRKLNLQIVAERA